jgi:hypothetical protein
LKLLSSSMQQLIRQAKAELRRKHGQDKQLSETGSNFREKNTRKVENKSNKSENNAAKKDASTTIVQKEIPASTTNDNPYVM